MFIAHVIYESNNGDPKITACESTKNPSAVPMPGQHPNSKTPVPAPPKIRHCPYLARISQYIVASRAFQHADKVDSRYLVELNRQLPARDGFGVSYDGSLTCENTHRFHRHVSVPPHACPATTSSSVYLALLSASRLPSTLPGAPSGARGALPAPSGSTPGSRYPG